ncbi:MAG: peptidoglycan DD-metalloendopeptidase family protein [Planctomycetota bacterium]|jgi:murein DD-endopeptidase MepM/ murein hydrolase activator NlpD
MRHAAKRSGAAFRRPSSAVSSLLSVFCALALLLAAGPLLAGEAPAPSEKTPEARVDAAVADMAARRNLQASEKVMLELGAAAVPRLVHHLKGTDRRRRMVALCVLHHCWSDAAREPLAAALKDRDPEVRELAAGALAKRLEPDDFRKLVGPLVEDESSYVASRILPLLEERAPDAARMKKCLARPALHEALAKHLPRYETAGLTPATLSLLSSFEKKVRRSAAAALTFQGPGSAEVRAKVLELLAGADPAVRDLAAEYFTWHGGKKDLDALRAAAAKEKDVWALASMRGALKVIGRRGDAPESRRSEGEDFEPVWHYQGRAAPEEFREGREERLDGQARALGIPQGTAMTDFENEAATAAAKELVPPVRDFFDPVRDSYGKRIGAKNPAFANSAHVGDDVAWHCDGQAVVAVGDGIVRRAGCTGTWGYQVIVEHVAPDGSKFCSLYAHLGPFVQVKPGDTVGRGQKIGAVGRSRTWENGGYWAHLHFGVHRGPFLHEYPVGSEVPFSYAGREVKGKVFECGTTVARLEVDLGGRKVRFGLRRRPLWICGYMDPAAFKAGGHGWVDPQKFVRQRVKPPAAR